MFLTFLAKPPKALANQLFPLNFPFSVCFPPGLTATRTHVRVVCGVRVGTVQSHLAGQQGKQPAVSVIVETGPWLDGHRLIQTFPGRAAARWGEPRPGVRRGTWVPVPTAGNGMTPAGHLPSLKQGILPFLL